MVCLRSVFRDLWGPEGVFLSLVYSSLEFAVTLAV